MRKKEIDRKGTRRIYTFNVETQNESRIGNNEDASGRNGQAVGNSKSHY